MTGLYIPKFSHTSEHFTDLDVFYSNLGLPYYISHHYFLCS